MCQEKTQSLHITTTGELIYLIVCIFSYLNTVIYAYGCKCTHGREGGENLFVHVKDTQPGCCIDEHRTFSVFITSLRDCSNVRMLSQFSTYNWVVHLCMCAVILTAQFILFVCFVIKILSEMLSELTPVLSTKVDGTRQLSG